MLVWPCAPPRQDYVSFSETSAGQLASRGYMRLKPVSNHGSRILSQLSYRYHTGIPVLQFNTPQSSTWKLNYFSLIFYRKKNDWLKSVFLNFNVCRPFFYSQSCSTQAVQLRCMGKLFVMRGRNLSKANHITCLQKGGIGKQSWKSYCHREACNPNLH